MNFRQQLQEAYEAGYESGLNELNLQTIRNFGTDLIYGRDFRKAFQRKQKSIEDAGDIAAANKRLGPMSPDDIVRYQDIQDLIQQMRYNLRNR